MKNPPTPTAPRKRGRPPGAKNKATKAALLGGVGRPTKATPQVLSTIVEGIRVGMDPARAAERAGVSRSTYFGWLRQGEDDPKGPFGPFSDAIRQALAEFVFEVSKTIFDSKDQPSKNTNTAASIFLLTHRVPKDYPRPAATVELSGPGGAPIGVRDVRALSDEDLEALAKEASGK